VTEPNVRPSHRWFSHGLPLRWSWGLLAFTLATIALLGASNLAVIRDERATTDQLEDLPIVKACLVLGTSKHLARGVLNPFYTYRMEAAVKVFNAGKCGRIVVSGDNRQVDYNEPQTMKESLIALGIPEAAILCDYAGRRTLDSVLRFKHIFGQTTGIVISQEFHNARAIYIGRHHGMSLVGFNAQEVGVSSGLKTHVREIFSRARAVADVWILHSQASVGGDPIAL
jgi:SanA protein